MREKPLAPRPATEPAASRLPLHAPNRDVILSAHAAALERGDAGYGDPDSGLFVLTASRQWRDRPDVSARQDVVSSDGSTRAGLTLA